MPMGLLKPLVQEKEWRVRGGVNELRGLVATSMNQSGFPVEEEDTSLVGAPYSGVSLHQKVKIGMTYGAVSHKSGGELGAFTFGKTKTGGPRLGETNRVHLWYYAQGEKTLIHARGVGMEKNLSQAFSTLEATLAPRAAAAPTPGP